jgi:catechol 2,3-dioxygenase-like lactoylglutathione lyase family enzyme
MPIRSLAHVCLKTTDLAATAEFYCGALGFTRQFDFTRAGKVVGFYLKAANDTFIEVFDAAETLPVEKQVLNHFCLEVDDLRALRESLAARGLAPGEVKLGCDQTPQFWMKDPNGLALEFQQYTENSAQRTGLAVEVNW